MIIKEKNSPKIFKILKILKKEKKQNQRQNQVYGRLASLVSFQEQKQSQKH